MLAVSSAKVMLKGKDVTNHGNMVIDEKTSKVPWTIKDEYVLTYAGQQPVMVIDAKIKPQADLTPYKEKDGVTRILNVGYMYVNGKEPIPSNKVNIIPV